MAEEAGGKLKQEAPDDAGALSSPEVRRSVTGSDGRSAPAAEAIVDSDSDHVHVLADPVAKYGREARINPDAEGVVRTPHEQMVVFNTDRPVRREAILKADPHSAAPARVAYRGQADPGDRVQYIKAIAGHSRAALQVEQCRVPGVTDLAGEEA